jgi:poly-beta-hydroxyalkanoate depolymerase
MIDFGIGFLLGVTVFYVLLRMAINYFRRQLEQMLKTVLESETELKTIEDRLEPKATAIHTRLEEVDGVFYVYNIDNGEFIAQGTTADEVQKHVQSRISNKDVFIVQGDNEAIKRYRSTKTAT